VAPAQSLRVEGVQRGDRGGERESSGSAMAKEGFSYDPLVFLIALSTLKCNVCCGL